MKLRVGDVVRRKGETRTVVELYRSSPGGVRLDRPVGDFRSWHQDELTFVRHGTTAEVKRIEEVWGRSVNV